MSMKQLVRHRVAMLLLLIVPSLFLSIIVLITPDRSIVFELATLENSVVQHVNEEEELVVFIGYAAVCLLTAFFALHLVQRQWETDRRIMVAGYRSSELLAAKLCVLGGIVILTSLYVSLLVLSLMEPRRYWAMMAGFLSGGYVYGCYGLLVGALVRRELEGVLCVILLSNIDASWVQNPVIYAQAEQQSIIRLLPGFYPAQVTMVGAFTNDSVLDSLLRSFLYGSSFLSMVLVIYARRMRVGRTVILKPPGGK